MSLLTDLVFVKAIRSNSSLIAQLPAGDVYNTSIALPDEDMDNAPLPYVIVSFDGMTTESLSKDSSFDGDNDHVTISIEVAAKTRPEVGNLLTSIRETINDYFTEHQYDDSDEDFALIPLNSEPSAGKVEYDPLKPCHWQILTYQCDTNP